MPERDVYRWSHHFSNSTTLVLVGTLHAAAWIGAVVVATLAAAGASATASFSFSSSLAASSAGFSSAGASLLMGSGLSSPSGMVSGSAGAASLSLPDFTALLGLRNRPPSLFLGLASPSESEASPFFAFLPKVPKKEVRRLSLGVVASAVASAAGADSSFLAASPSAGASVSPSAGLLASSTGFSS